MIEMTRNFFEECDKHYKAGEQDGYERGYKDGQDKGFYDGKFIERAELQRAFERLLGNEYSFQEICDMADLIRREENEINDESQTKYCDTALIGDSRNTFANKIKNLKCKDCSNYISQSGYCMIEQDYKNDDDWCPALTITIGDNQS